MRAVVTGSAGFIGSTLVDRLLRDGHHVTGIDRFSDYYAGEQKRRNLEAAGADPRFELVEGDLVSIDLPSVLEGADVVFHQAAQPGVRLSWAAFDRYLQDNVLATQRLLEATRERPGTRFVYASSSSVYGDAVTYPTPETATPRPVSPYGVTKLAAEHLCGTYAKGWGVDTIALRYFTVYGPRQRPDMAIHRLIDAALTGASFPLLGDGSQIRDFTFVDDIVEANVLAATSAALPGSVVNVAGTASWSMREVVELVEKLTDRPIAIDQHAVAQGDVVRTGGDTRRAAEQLGWRAATPLEDGVARQVAWHLEAR